MKGYVSARKVTNTPIGLLKERFGSEVKGASDALFADSGEQAVAGVSGLSFKAPVMVALFANADFARYARGIVDSGNSLLIAASENANPAFLVAEGKVVKQVDPGCDIAAFVARTIEDARSWGGAIETDGSHVIDLVSPLPGPHFAVNLLLGDRSNYAFPLQTTPKSVVDRLGRGSFRSHAATQVLATRWDIRQEENGFPCNRQFYLMENGERIFYSADPADPRVVEATCSHLPNRTVIRYALSCGLEIVRSIFILPQEDGLPLAVEVQRIEVRNRGKEKRTVRLVTTGMFGPSKPGALQEDVLYSTIIMEGGLFRDDAGNVLAVSPSYQPIQDRDDRRFSSLVIHDDAGTRYPREFSLDYTEFTGSGTLERPQGLAFLGNRINRRGPGFFAFAGELTIKAGGTAVADSFTGLVSARANPSWDEASLEREVGELLARYRDPQQIPKALDRVTDYQSRFSSYLRIDSGDPAFSAYCCKNLPFQVLYQSFVSRSFAQTQKGYREMGFREIQDLYASMLYFHAMGRSGLVRELILQWASQVYEFGYANHNFFWEGKEPGKWSDDALWLHQAVGRYVALTGDSSILAAKTATADRNGTERTLFATLVAALRYSTEISVGPHGIPLLDLADWNDCLKIDRAYVNGPEKERIWKKEGKYASRGVESVMNGFLAVTAARDLAVLARVKGDSEIEAWSAKTAERLEKCLRDSAWIGRNYARLLISDNPSFAFVGADGDGLDTDGTGGTLFLNSFSWSVLSGVANDAEIATMLSLVRSKLKTPYGLMLSSPMDLTRIVPGVATSEYFPGDRENGAVFKHAAMMAVSAFFDAAKRVRDPALARELAREAWEMIDLAYPARTMKDPFVIAGNPRFCTQYNNSETGENIGPLLSGTATWLVLSLMKGFGIEHTADGLRIDPILREGDRELKLSLRLDALTVEILLKKGDGFARSADGAFTLTVDGAVVQGNLVSLAGKKGVCRIEGTFAS